MTQVELTPGKAIPEGLVEELVKKSVYCSPDLKHIEVLDNGKRVRLSVTEGANADQVKDKVSRFIAGMVRGYRKFDKKRIFSNEVEPTYTKDVWAELQRCNWVFDCGFGQVGLRGPALGLYQYFENTFLTMAREHFGADEWQFPALIPADVMGRCNYFNSFPQAVTFVAHLSSDFDTLEEFSLANKEGPLRFPSTDVLEKPSYCLAPVICYHCYRTLEGVNLARNETRIFTALGPCFRFESRNTTSMERLWNFTMREFVFVGSQEGVQQARKKSMDVVSKWIESIGIRACFETASDPFFTTDFSEKTYFQMLSDLKYEIRVNIDPENTIAAGSFNLANDFFGKVFSISSGSTPAFTSCVGFGYERWIYAFICQKGFEPAAWPKEAQRFISELA